MRSVMTIVGTRPELIKMSRVISEFDKYTRHTLVHTGQNYDYELNEVFFKDLGIRKPNYFLESAGENPASTIASIIEKSYEVMLQNKPDAILLYGDTNSCLSVIAAKRLKIPVFHMEAGNRCFDQRVPEELNRKVLDHLSDINFVLTEHARRYLIAEGIKPEMIIKTGSHMPEVLSFHAKKIEQSEIIKILKLKKQEFFIVSLHREENVDVEKNLISIIQALNDLIQKYNFPIIVSTHPRTQERLNNLKDIKIRNGIKFLKPFSFCDYIKLQKESLCVISDSGTITEEASILNLNAITIRNMHERPEGMDVGTLIMSGLRGQEILDAVSIVLNQSDDDKRIVNEVEDYESSKTVSIQILRCVISYIDYINKNVWSKDNV